jgi:4-oxalocrotonate tautomerase
MGKVQDIVEAILFLENAVLSMGEIPRVDRWPAGHCQNGAMAWAAALPVNNQRPVGRRRTIPIVNIQITREGTIPGHTSVTRQQKAQLIEGVSKLLLDVLNKPMNSTFVVIDEVDVENWGWGGLPVEEYRKRMAASADVPDTKLMGIAKE